MGLQSTFDNLAKIKDLAKQLAENIQQLQVVNDEKIKLWKEAMQAVGLSVMEEPRIGGGERNEKVLIQAQSVAGLDFKTGFHRTYFNFYEDDVAQVIHRFKDERFASVTEGSWQNVFEQIVAVLAKDVPEVYFHLGETPLSKMVIEKYLASGLASGPSPFAGVSNTVIAAKAMVTPRSLEKMVDMLQSVGFLINAGAQSKRPMVSVADAFMMQPVTDTKIRLNFYENNHAELAVNGVSQGITSWNTAYTQAMLLAQDGNQKRGIIKIGPEFQDEINDLSRRLREKNFILESELKVAGEVIRAHWGNRLNLMCYDDRSALLCLTDKMQTGSWEEMFNQATEIIVGNSLAKP